jgi:hypothetical protein
VLADASFLLGYYAIAVVTHPGTNASPYEHQPPTAKTARSPFVSSVSSAQAALALRLMAKSDRTLTSPLLTAIRIESHLLASRFIL